MKCFRCMRCGKWSHAKRKPKSHVRGTYEEPDESTEIVSHEHAYGGEYGFESPEFWLVKCGPFETYWLTPEVVDLTQG